ncbi:DUF1439 domain-containing protein [Alkalimarinus alittae]|uniref:DUF1439 domain-containing protein n=1 Tax=Alkalimarinus alittae TaxID=2961619 RepID=A0ABY6N1U0_9ALTE|nr:DUF1439 domain-containing protein [Alkalimarinus alittae]UZE96080.1 DUF1439 domain-containing protein [Alkalimarinus alittae]
MAMLSTVIQPINFLRSTVLILLGAMVLSGCNEKQPEQLFLKESEIQAGLDQQLPVNGIVNVQIHIPDEVASLSGFFAERVVSDPIVEAKVELNSADVALINGETDKAGRINLIAKPVIRTTILGFDIAESLSIELTGHLIAREESLYFEPTALNETGSFFFNNFVPKEYRSQFIENLNDWFVAYFSAYPVYTLTPNDRFSPSDIKNATLTIEDDLVRFH